jgi:hypothetical protein
LSQVYKLNTGQTNYPISKIVDPEFGTIKNTTASEYCSLMWKQTRTLFGKSYLRITAILCYLQFGTLSFNMAMLLYFPKLLQDSATYSELRPGDNSLTTCGIQNFLSNHSASESNEITCINKMAFEAFGYPMITEITYTVGFFLIGFLLKYFGIWILSSEIL